MVALVEFDVAEARINCNIHPDKLHRELSSSRLANGRLHAYHSVIAMSLLHPALLILTLFIVLRLRSMKIKLPLKFHRHHSVYGAGVGGTTRPRLTLKTIVVMLEKCVMYLLVILYAYRSVVVIFQLHPALLILTLFIVLHIRLMFNFRIHLKRYHLSHSADVRSFKLNNIFHHKRCHHSYKTTSCRSRQTLKTTVVMLGYAEKDEMYLLAIIHQCLIISGDVELNPGPLGGEQILHSLGVCYCILQFTNLSGWAPSSLKKINIIIHIVDRHDYSILISKLVQKVMRACTVPYDITFIL